LDGERLGRIKSPEEYRVRSGWHVLSAARIDDAPEDGLQFRIEPGQTILIAVRGVIEEYFNIFSMEYETEVGSHPEIRIFEL